MRFVSAPLVLCRREAAAKAMNTSGFKYSVRLPGAADVVNLDWLASKFLATLDALTKIDSNI